jgi:hypothetical protein
MGKAGGKATAATKTKVEAEMVAKKKDGIDAAGGDGPPMTSRPSEAKTESKNMSFGQMKNARTI